MSVMTHKVLTYTECSKEEYDDDTGAFSIVDGVITYYKGVVE